MLNTPVLFNIFNRPKPTQMVFDMIRSAKPAVLYVHADGPRTDYPDDVNRCQLTRDIILSGVDWNCEVHTLFRDKNLGCGRGPASAITWFFENVEQGIILEDDCLPHPEFFTFCEDMLERYRDNYQITSIAGSNFQDGRVRGKYSYYFSKHNRIWGWASWRRVWQQYDYTLSFLSETDIQKILARHFSAKREYNMWQSIYKHVKLDRFDDSCWDYQFMLLQWYMNGATITPNRNLISNIGNDADATHTNWGDNRNLNRKVESIYPLIYMGADVAIKTDCKADRYYVDTYLLGYKTLVEKFFRKIYRMLIKVL